MQQNDLPDDTLLDNVLLTGRCRHIARWGTPEIKTVGDLRKLSDAELLAYPNCGKMALLEFRLLTGQRKPGLPNNPSEQSLKQRWVREVYYGTCNCSFEDWRKEQRQCFRELRKAPDRWN